MIITERLQKYMECKGLNPNQITVEASLSVGLIGKAIKQQRGLNSDTIEKILYKYKDINPTWFITGEGDMLISNESKAPTSKPMANNDKYIKSLENRIEELKDRIEELKKHNSDKDYIIQLKNEKINILQAIIDSSDTVPNNIKNVG